MSTTTFQKSLLVTAIATALVGCGGGGGSTKPQVAERPSEPVNTTTTTTTGTTTTTTTTTTTDSGTTTTTTQVTQDPGYLRDDVPFHTPVSVGTWDPLSGSTYRVAISDIYNKDLNNDNVDEVVVGGRLTQPADNTNWENYNMQLFGWNNGSFQNETSTWFNGNDNQIVGTEPSVKFGDYNGDGHMDMAVAASTDTNSIYGDLVVFYNDGDNSFTRVTETSLGDTWSHDSWSGDINGDGIDDMLVTDYGSGMTLMLGSASGFVKYDTDLGGYADGASGISVADYLGNGTKTVILTDVGSAGNSYDDSSLYSINYSNGTLNLTKIADLPESRFNLDKWADARANVTVGYGAHAIRNFTMDFDNDGDLDVIIVDILATTLQNDAYSEMQFLANDGSGNFTDVTDNILVNYDNTTAGSYQPIIMDVNGDGLDDIYLSAMDVEGVNDSTRVLVQTTDGKYVEKYQEVFTEFTNQIKNQTSFASVEANMPIRIIRGPDGENYLFTMLEVRDGETRFEGYLAKIGATGTVTAQNVADTLTAVWPYLSSAEVNTVLANTAPLSFDGVPVVDLYAALQPVGGLGFSLDGGATRFSISGSLSFAGIDTSVFEKVHALDGIGRNYVVDASSLVSEAPTQMMTVDNSNTVTEKFQPWASTYASKTFVNTGSWTGAGYDRNWSITKQNEAKFANNTYWSVTASSVKGASPWVAMSGAFGDVKDSTTVELTLTKTFKEGVWVQGGVMNTHTNINKGLVTKVDDVQAVYAVAGYTNPEAQLTVVGGIEPVAVNGGLDLTLPSGVDANGAVQYTNHNMDIRNPVVGFVGVRKGWTVDDNNSFSVDTTVRSNGDTRAMVRYAFSWE